MAKETGGYSSGSSMLAGMKDRSPKDGDASMRCKGGSVDSEPTRKGTAPTPKTLGPREA